MKLNLPLIVLSTFCAAAQTVIQPIRLGPPSTNVYSEGSLSTNLNGTIVSRYDFVHSNPPYGVEFEFNSETNRLYVVEVASSVNNFWLEFGRPTPSLLGVYNVKPDLNTNVIHVSTNTIRWKVIGQPFLGNGSNVVVHLNSLSPEAYFRVKKL